MKPYLRLGVVAFAVLLIAGFTTRQIQKHRDESENDDAYTTGYLVNVSPYDAKAENIAIFQELIAAKIPPGKEPIVVEQETCAGNDLYQILRDSKPQDFQGISSSLLTDWKQRNRQSQTLAPFQAQHPLVFVPHAKIARIFKSGFWAAFYKQYPGSAGLAAFSLPALSADDSKALVYFRHSYGGQGGEGYLYYLGKVSGRWKIIRAVYGWMA